MAAVTPTSVRGVAYRITRQDECDVPVTTPNRILASNAFIRAVISPDVDDRNELLVYNADNSICVQDITDPRFKGWNVTLHGCNLDPLVVEMLVGGTILSRENADVHGAWMPGLGVTGRRNSVQLELWSRNGGKGTCLTAGDTPSQYIRWIMPRTVSWTVNEDLTFERNGHQFIGLTGYAEDNPSFTPALGLDATVDIGSGNESNDPPAATTNDPDLNGTKVLAARAQGALGFVTSDTLPTFNPGPGQYVV